MSRIKSNADIIALVTSLIAGVTIALALPLSLNVKTVETFPETLCFEALKSFALPLCVSTVAQASIIFASSIALYPLMIQIPLFLFRGAALGFSLASLPHADARAYAGVISYILISFLLLILCRESFDFSKAARKVKRKKLFPLALSFMTICGAAIVVKILPVIITEKLL